MRRIDLLLVGALVIMTIGLSWASVGVGHAGTDVAYLRFLPLAVAFTGLIVTTLVILTRRNLHIRNETLSELSAMRVRGIEQRELETQQAVENAVTPVFILNGEQHIIFANQAAQTCFGFGTSEMVGLAFSDVIHTLPDVAPDTAHNALGTTKRGKGILLCVQNETWITAEGAMRTTAIVRDVTADQAMQQATERRLSTYASAMRGAGLGMVDIDLRASTWRVCDTFREIIGLGSEDRADTHHCLWDRVHDEDTSKLQESDASCIEGRAKHAVAEVRVRNDAGGWQLMRWDVRVAGYGADRMPISLVATLCLVPPEVASQDTPAMSELKTALRAKLTSVRGALNGLAEQQETLPSPQRQLLDIARTNADNVSELIAEILETEPGPAVLGALDIGKAAALAARNMGDFTAKQGSTLSLDVSDRPLWVLGDALQIQQILMDMISTSCHFARGQSEILIKVEAHEGLAMIYVQNRGPGINDQQHQEIFEADAQSNFGLYRARQIVRKQGGELGVESVPESVTVFWLTYPLTAQQGATIQEEAEQLQANTC
ncbi:MAG: PAS domain-containing sensor histidine kinase [Sulfitobacter sp.]